jgi:Protein of unknown function (DUF2752)
MLGIACLVFAASFLLEVEQGTEVALAGMPQLVMPPLCMAREWFGVRCPGCGLTRSFIHLAHGRFESSWQAHRLGWLLAVALLVQIPYRIHVLCKPHRQLVSTKFSVRFRLCLIGLLIGNWLVEILTGKLTI